MQYADIVIAALGVLAVAWIADLMGGRRGFGGAVLVAATGAVCGWFLAVRVFALYTQNDWRWVGWSLLAAAAVSLIYRLFRSKR